MNIIALLTSRLAGPVASGAALLFAAILAWVVIDKNAAIRGLDSQINNPETGYIVRLQQAQGDLVQCRSNRITLEEATRRQNEAVEQEAKASEARLAQLARAAAEARRDAAAANEEAAKILNRQSSGDACRDAEALIRETVQ
jgi:hypothetical protein